MHVKREDLYEKAYWHGEHPDVENPFADGVTAVDVSDIEDIPAADVAPVVHGYWSKVGGDLHSSGYPVACSRCHKYVFVHYKGSLGSLDGHDELFEAPVLCPHCGANMK